MDSRDGIRVQIVNKIIQGTLDETFKWNHEVITVTHPLNTNYESRKLYTTMFSGTLSNFDEDLFTAKIGGKVVAVINNISFGRILIDDVVVLRSNENFLSDYITNPVISLINILQDKYAGGTPTSIRLDEYLNLLTTCLNNGRNPNVRYQK